MHLNFSMRLLWHTQEIRSQEVRKEPEFGCCEASWPIAATSKVLETLLRDLPSLSLTPLRLTTPGDEEGVANNYTTTISFFTSGVGE